MNLVFATNNRHKIEEISQILGNSFNLLGLPDLDIREEIPEDYETLEENAMQKARYIYDRSNISCFADDTGLEVDALGGEPGVYSARYSRIGSPVYDSEDITGDNIKKLLEKLAGKENRSARFRTVIVLIMKGREYKFEGVVPGRIIESPRGTMGFGYDPVFIPEGYEITFAEMGISEKNRISHRARAVNNLIKFLNEYNKQSEIP